MIKKFLLLSLFTIVALLGVNTQKIEASNVVSKTQSIMPNQEVIGEATLYDDFIVKITYKYKVKNVILQVGFSNSDTYEIYKDNNVYSDSKKAIVIDLTQHFELIDGAHYNIRVDMKFVADKNGDLLSPVSISGKDISYIKNTSNTDKESDDIYEQEIVKGADKFKQVLKLFVVPILYGVLGIVLVVKSILLAMDLVKFSDFPDIRSQKIKAYTYLAIAIAIMLVVNTFSGWYAGLFG